MISNAFADGTAVRRFHLARLGRFLGLIDQPDGEGSAQRADLARRASITAYCDCYDAGAGPGAQELMDRFLDMSPRWASGLSKPRRPRPLRPRRTRGR